MPTLSVFYGIIVRMYAEIGGQHNCPHFHAEYQGQKIVVSLDGEILEGSLPTTKLHMLLAWAAIHQEDLEPVFTRRKERGKIEIWKKKDGSRTLAT